MAWTSSAEVARPDPHQKKSILVSPAKHPLLLRKQRVFFEFRPHFRRPHGVNPKVHTPLAHARIRARQSVSVFHLHPSPTAVVSLSYRRLGVKVRVNLCAVVGFTRG